jgi:uncharacterized membrane protein YkvA (DUF1232 family)
MISLLIIAMVVGSVIPTTLLWLLLKFEESKQRGAWMKRLGLLVAGVCGAYIALPYDFITDATPGVGLLDDSIAAFNMAWASWHAVCGWLEERRDPSEPPTGTTGDSTIATAMAGAA